MTDPPVMERYDPLDAYQRALEQLVDAAIALAEAGDALRLDDPIADSTLKQLQLATAERIEREHGHRRGDRPGEVTQDLFEAIGEAAKALSTVLVHHALPDHYDGGDAA